MADVNFRHYAEGDPIPPVDPEDIKRLWNLKPPWGPGNDQQSACTPGADVAAVSRRWAMIDTLTIYKLLSPWQHGEELDDAVFRIAATFPTRELRSKKYMISGDEHFGFDPNAFVHRLIEETGVSHVWEPVPTKVPEGGRSYVTISANFKGQGPPDPEREAKHQARELLWQIWIRFADLGDLLPLRDKWTVYRAAELFDHFVINNDDLLRKVEAGFRTGNGADLPVLMEVERRAQRIPGLG